MPEKTGKRKTGGWEKPLDSRRADVLKKKRTIRRKKVH